jgi:hypothetical protein
LTKMEYDTRNQQASGQTGSCMTIIPKPLVM